MPTQTRAQRINSALAIRVEGELDREKLRRALATVFSRHEALRTVLLWDDASARQVVLEGPELPFEDISATARRALGSTAI